jgi:hypothetical protein
MLRTVRTHWVRSFTRPSIGVPSLASRITVLAQWVKLDLFVAEDDPSNVAQGQATSICARTPLISAASCAAEGSVSQRTAAAAAGIA